MRRRWLKASRVQRRLWLYGTVHMCHMLRLAGDATEAIAFGERARTIAESLGEISLQVTANLYLGAACLWTGDVPRAKALLLNVLPLLEHAPIHGDPLLLPELIDNLIDNALRYTPSGGAVTVNTGSETTTSYLTVEDTGPGIPAGERNRVRERFYRVAGTPGDGSGLGLAIAQEVVDRHAGVLEIASRNGSGGTRVRVSFPRSDSAEV